jgi:serine/threonine protein kinase
MENYKKIKQLETGGFAQVFLVKHLKANKFFVLKKFHFKLVS